MEASDVVPPGATERQAALPPPPPPPHDADRVSPDTQRDLAIAGFFNALTGVAVKVEALLDVAIAEEQAGK